MTVPAFPAGHEVHPVLCFKGWLDPAGHTMQTVRPFEEVYLPALQSTHTLRSPL